MSRRNPTADSPLALSILDLLARHGDLGHADLISLSGATSADVSEALRALRTRCLVTVLRGMGSNRDRNVYVLAIHPPKNPQVVLAPAFRPPLPMSARTLGSIATLSALAGRR